jgi:anionic cell wall polymer biosynthesis LytR-Cps2A-Psr (LCP) family protein
MSDPSGLDSSRSSIRLRLSPRGFQTMMNSLSVVSYRFLTYVTFAEIVLIGLFHAKDLSSSVFRSQLIEVIDGNTEGRVVMQISLTGETQELVNKLTKKLENDLGHSLRRQDLILALCLCVTTASDTDLKDALADLRSEFKSPTKWLTKEMSVWPWDIGAS